MKAVVNASGYGASSADSGRHDSPPGWWANWFPGNSAVSRDEEEQEGLSSSSSGRAAEPAASGGGGVRWPFSATSNPNATPEEASGAAEGTLMPDLALSTRIQLFVLCQILAVVTNFIAWVALSTGRYNRSVALTTLANLVSILGTTFLMGLRRQCSSMFDPIRRTATLIYLGSLVLTLVAAVSLRSTGICVLMSCVQYAALLWYSLSFIPYGRTVATSAVKGLVGVVVSV